MRRPPVDNFRRSWNTAGKGSFCSDLQPPARCQRLEEAFAFEAIMGNAGKGSFCRDLQVACCLIWTKTASSSLG